MKVIKYLFMDYHKIKEIFVLVVLIIIFICIIYQIMELCECCNSNCCKCGCLRLRRRNNRINVQPTELPTIVCAIPSEIMDREIVIGETPSSENTGVYGNCIIAEAYIVSIPGLNPS